ITSADLQRDLEADSLTVSAKTEAKSESEADASSKGESDSGKSSDDQSKDQVKNNPNTNGKTDGDLPKGKDQTDTANNSSSSESGEKSGGVNIAAAVALNWVRHTTTSSIGDGFHTPTVTTEGAVKVSSENLLGANAKAIGLSTNLKSDVAIAAGGGFQLQDIQNYPPIGGGPTAKRGAGTVEAGTPVPKENDFIAWGLAGAGGKGEASVAASVGIQVLFFDSKAWIGQGAHVTSSDAIEIKSTNVWGLQNIALAGGLSTSGTAVGRAVSVNVATVTTQAYIDSGTSG